MSDAPKNDEKTGEEDSKAPEVEEPKTEDPKPEGEEPKTFTEDYVKQLREENASRRTRLKEVEEQLATMKSTEEVDELVKTLKTERETSERKLLVEVVATKFKLPEALAKRLSGDTREALEADAKELAALVKSDESDDEEDTRLEGGLSPRDRDADSTDPRELAKTYGKRRR